MSEQWENTADPMPSSASGDEDRAAQSRPDQRPPDNTTPAEIVSASESTDPSDRVPDDIAGEHRSGESFEPSPLEPDQEPEPEHEPQGIAVAVEEDRPVKLDWYILKVQSNREDSIREGLLRRVQMAGLEKYFAEVIVPIEMVTEFKGGKKRVIKRKLYPGYLVVQMEINDDTWFLVRETPGIGDFTGSAGQVRRRWHQQEVSRIVVQAGRETRRSPQAKDRVKKGDRVKINEGTFENFEGEVDTIDEASGRVTCNDQHLRPAPRPSNWNIGRSNRFKE